MDNDEEQTPAENEAADDEGTYPAKVVRDLRKENAAHRERIQKLSRELLSARVKATGKLVNPEEFPYDAALLDDDDALNAAIDQLTEAKPYLKARNLSGDVGQGERGKITAPQDFSTLLRG